MKEGNVYWIILMLFVSVVSPGLAFIGCALYFLKRYLDTRKAEKGLI